MLDFLPVAVTVLFLVVLMAAVVKVRARNRVEPDWEALEADLRKPGEAQLEPAEAPRAVPRISAWSRGLAKTRSALGATLKTLRFKERLDAGDWEEVEEALLRADLGIDATGRVMQALRQAAPAPAEVPSALRRELVQILEQGDSTLQLNAGEVAVWLVIGVNGVGKTTSIAKLAHRLKQQGRSVVLAAADTFRAAAIEQLGTWAGRLEVHMVRHAPGADPGAVVFDAIEHARARDIDVVIVDTAGRLHTKVNLMEELKKVRRIAGRETGAIAEVLLVLDATVGQNGLAQARAFKEAMGATGVILTKLDGTARGGIVVAVQEELGIPVKAVGVGEGIEDLESFDPQAFVEAMLE